jgi:hypothetical protein
MVTHWLIFIVGCWVGVTAGFGLALVLMGPKLRRLDESEEDFFGPTLAYRQSAAAVRRQQARTPGMPPPNARPSHIA